MSWSSEDFESELSDVSKLVNMSQASATLHDSLVMALQKKVENSSTLMPSDFVRCLEAVDKSSLPPEQKQKLSDAVVAKAAAATQEQGNKTVRSPQSLTNLPAYCTKDELTTLMSGDINLAGVTIVQRLRRVGLTSMKEDTKRAAVALEVQSFIWHGMPKPSPDEIYAKAQQLSKLFLGDQTTSPVSPVKNYPSLPTGLGEEWISKVYGSERPSLMSLPGFAALQIDCPVRETHRLLSWNQKKDLLGSNRRGQAGVGGMNLHGCMEKMLGDAVQQVMQNTFFGGQGGLSNLKIFDKKPASAMENLALARQQLGLPALADQQTNAPAQLSIASMNPTAAQSSSAAAQPCIGNSASAAQQSMQAADPTSAVHPSPAADSAPASPQTLVQTSPSLHDIMKISKDNNTKQNSKKSLEDYEQEHMAMLESKKDASAKRLKRKTAPADKGSKAEGSKPTKATHSSKPKQAKAEKGKAAAVELCWGCTRCRGNPKGCPSCNHEGFQGMRLNGRRAWEKYVAEKKKKGKK